MKKQYYFISIVILIAILTVFGSNTIKEYKEEVKRLKKENTELIIDKYDLSVKISNFEKEKDIKITKTINKDGSSLEVKEIKTKESKESISAKESKENINLKKDTLETEDKKIYEKIIKNPKKLNFSVGINNNLDKSIHIDYNFLGPLTIGGWIEDNKIGIKLGIGF